MPATSCPVRALRIRVHLAGAQKELQQWDYQFAILLAHRARVADRVYRCNVALAPYKRLPVEITREIMLLAAGASTRLPLSKETALDPRLQITQVCAGWRRIAFDTPELWALTFSLSRGSPSVFELANSWWSQCSVLRLSLNTDNLYDPNLTGTYNDRDGLLFDHIISPFSSRLTNLQVILRPVIAEKLLALPAGSFYALENLTLRVDYRHRGDFLRSGQDLNTALGLCPRLSQVAVYTNSLIEPWLLRVPWTQLTWLLLVTQNLPADILLLLLSHCTLLTTCTIITIKDIDTNMVKRISKIPVSIRLKELRRLCVEFAGPMHRGHFLRALSVPKLSTFEMACSTFVEWNASDYADFLRNTASTLETFEILGPHPQPHPQPHRQAADPPNFSVNQALISSLRHISTFAVPANYSILSPELEDIASGQLLPSVTKMELGAQELGPVLEMLEARLSLSNQTSGQSTISPIRWVSLKCPEPDSHLQSILNGLEERGIDIMIDPL